MKLTRRPLCPHESVVIRNTSGGPQLVRFCPEFSNSGFGDQDLREHLQCSYAVHFTPEQPPPEEPVVDVTTVYTLQPGQAVIYVFQGEMRPPPNFPREDLLVALCAADHYTWKYGLKVPPLKVTLCFKYKPDSLIYEAAYDDSIEHWWQSGYAGTLRHTITSLYTAQPVECSFFFQVSSSQSPEETQRCCLVHIPKLYQNTFVYYPHYIRPSVYERTVRTCNCCLV
jgi:hypothetical protein